jgi:hypothetical protein
MLKTVFLSITCCLLLVNTHILLASEPEYDQALVNAALHRGGLAPHPLTVIQGSTIKMAVFTTYSNYKTSDTKAGADIWATVEPDLKQLCTKYVKQQKKPLTHEQLTLWLAQLLGLPSKNAENRQFVVLEVPVIQAYYGTPYSLTGIYRPCSDPQIGPHSDGTPACSSQMRVDEKIATEFKTWFINYSLSTYKDQGMPWTEYGYTYNWNPHAESVYGLAEFVIAKNTSISVLSNPQDSSTAYFSPEQYCSSS